MKDMWLFVLGVLFVLGCAPVGGEPDTVVAQADDKFEDAVGGCMDEGRLPAWSIYANVCIESGVEALLPDWACPKAKDLIAMRRVLEIIRDELPAQLRRRGYAVSGADFRVLSLDAGGSELVFNGQNVRRGANRYGFAFDESAGFRISSAGVQHFSSTRRFAEFQKPTSVEDCAAAPTLAREVAEIVRTVLSVECTHF